MMKQEFPLFELIKLFGELIVIEMIYQVKKSRPLSEEQDPQESGRGRKEKK